MAEALAAVASIVAVIQISQAVIGACCLYASSIKEVPLEIHRAATEVGSLQVILRDLKSLVEKTPTDQNGHLLSTLNAMNAKNGPFQSCHTTLLDIQRMLGTPAKLMAPVRAILWPWQVKALHEALNHLQKQKESISLTLATDQAYAMSDVHREIRELRLSLQQEKILAWLSKIDPSTNHNAACDKQEPLTGNWFLTSPEFSQYLHGEKHRGLWCHGIPGCGKTILFSTIVEYVRAWRNSLPTIQYAYFYFDFQDAEKQGATVMLKSVLAQLASRNADLLGPVEELFFKCDNGRAQPQRQDLLDAWSSITQGDRKIYILLDALDECSERTVLMKLLLDMFNRPHSNGNVKLLTTSRVDNEIEDMFGHISTAIVPLDPEKVDPDIRLMVRNILAYDNKFKRWPEHVKGKIQTSLVNKAQGMFRWVECQLEDLRRCLSLKAIETALENLPHDLDETYHRIIAAIPRNYRKEAVTVLRWLAFSYRPLSLVEIAEAIAITPDGLDTSLRLLDIQYVLEICAGLVTVQDTANHTTNEGATAPNDKPAVNRKFLRLAHFSVKEFLVSGRTETKDDSREFTLSPATSHLELAHASIIYLISDQFKAGKSLNDLDLFPKLTEFPLLNYTAEYWTMHATESGLGSDTRELSLKLLVSNDGHFFASMLQVLQATQQSVKDELEILGFADTSHDKTNIRRLNQALMFAAAKGLNSIFGHILMHGAQVDAIDLYCTTALTTAVRAGNYTGVRALLDLGANINWPDSTVDASRYLPSANSRAWDALSLAIAYGHTDIIELLLSRGADPKGYRHQTGGSSSALATASYNGNVQLIRKLLDNFSELRNPEEWLFALLEATKTKRLDSFECLLECMPKSSGLYEKFEFLHPNEVDKLEQCFQQIRGQVTNQEAFGDLLFTRLEQRMESEQERQRKLEVARLGYTPFFDSSFS